MSLFHSPDPHPLNSETLRDRYTRAMVLSSLCTDYANSVQLLVKNTLSRDDPYRGGVGEALLTITASREVLRTARSAINTSSMDPYFASMIQENIALFEKNHPHLKQARDVIAHVDEYIKSTGRDKSQWFDTVTRFGENFWIFRIGNELDIDMVKLASDVLELSSTVQRVTSFTMYIESKLEKPGKLVKDLMERGIYVSLRIEGDTGTMTINHVSHQSDFPNETHPPKTEE